MQDIELLLDQPLAQVRQAHVRLDEARGMLALVGRGDLEVAHNADGSDELAGRKSAAPTIGFDEDRASAPLSFGGSCVSDVGHDAFRGRRGNHPYGIDRRRAAALVMACGDAHRTVISSSPSGRAQGSRPGLPSLI